MNFNVNLLKKKKKEEEEKWEREKRKQSKTTENFPFSDGSPNLFLHTVLWLWNFLPGFQVTTSKTTFSKKQIIFPCKHSSFQKNFICHQGIPFF